MAVAVPHIMAVSTIPIKTISILDRVYHYNYSIASQGIVSINADDWVDDYGNRLSTPDGYIIMNLNEITTGSANVVPRNISCFGSCSLRNLASTTTTGTAYIAIRYAKTTL